MTDLSDNYYTITDTNALFEKTAEDFTRTYTTIETKIFGDENEDGLIEQVSEIHTMIRESADGIEVGKSDSNIKGVFSNDSLDFIDNEDTKQAWVDAQDGLGGRQISIGNPEDRSKRWRIFIRDNGSHLTFTRHS